jgi:hypothetical protein
LGTGNPISYQLLNEVLGLAEALADFCLCSVARRAANLSKMFLPGESSTIGSNARVEE